MVSAPGCVFCAIVSGTDDARIAECWPDAIAIVPLNPVVDGHRLIIPRVHIADAAEHPLIAGEVASRAAALGACGKRPFNLITSVGPEATQTVFHLHWHYVPRAAGDGLMLPWSSH